jgi:hypothetical protein
VKTLDLMFSTMLAELGQRSLDATFTTDYNLAGRFVRNVSKGKEYWYFQEGDQRRYVGRMDDEEINKRVEEFAILKDDFRTRRKLVSTLTREAGLTAPDRLTGDVVETLARAGIFRLRAVVVGTVAFQTYSAILGVRLPSAIAMTGDVDLAQDFAISHEVEDSIPPILDLLQNVDPTFRAIPHQGDKARVTAFQNRTGYRVEFLTANRGSDDFTGHPSAMPALGGASAEPLRFLDFLIRDPVRTVMLHGAGVSILVPAPERYAVHKLIVATRRRVVDNDQKREKDIKQAGHLFEALTVIRRQDDLAVAWTEAWGRGEAWRAAMISGAGMLHPVARDALRAALAEGGKRIGEKVDLDAL